MLTFDCSTTTQHSLLVCMTFRWCLKTWSLTEWHQKCDNCRPTSPLQLLTRRRGTTSSPAFGRIQIWNIGTKQIQVKEIKKSVCTASLHKGGQMGGGGSRGSSEIIWGENFYAIGSNALSTHGRFQLYPILPTHILFWLWKWPLKLKYLFFRVSFSRLTFKSGGDPV